MEGLRWILLGCGILLVAGIYFADRIKRRTAQHRDDMFDDSGWDSDLNISPHAADDSNDYSDAIADLNHLLSENRESVKDRGIPDIDADIARAWDIDTAGDSEQAPKDITEPEPGESPQSERLIILYLKAPEGHAFAGPALFEALTTAGLSLGDMGIYHDIDSRGRIVFSIANMFEPGTLETDDVENFSTRGVALFMQLPGPAEPQDAFERMLAKAEILSERLGGELHDDQHRPLDDSLVTSIRDSLG